MLMYQYLILNKYYNLYVYIYYYMYRYVKSIRVETLIFFKCPTIYRKYWFNDTLKFSIKKVFLIKI